MVTKMTLKLKSKYILFSFFTLYSLLLLSLTALDLFLELS